MDQGGTRTAGRHRAGDGLPRRPEGGGEQARAHVAARGAHRAGPPGITDIRLLRRVRDALAGRRP